MDRRTFLKWGTALPLAALARPALATSPAATRNTMVLLDGLNSASDAPRLEAVMNGLISQGVPVSCLIELSHANGPLSPDHPVARLLREMRTRLPGLVDLVPVLPELGQLNAHFQARRTYEGQAQLFDQIWGPQSQSDFRPGTVACDLFEAPLAPTGIRTSAIRNVLMRPAPGESMPVQSQNWPNGVARLIGGQRVTLDLDAAALQSDPSQPGERLLYLSLADLADLPPEAITAQASRFAIQVMTPDRGRWVNPILASDLQFRDAYGYQRKMALHFLIGADASAVDRAALTEFRLELLEAGVPSSFGEAVPAGPLAGGHDGYWVDIQRTKALLPILPLQHFRARDAALSPQALSAERQSYGLGVQFTARAAARTAGLTPDNTLVLPAEVIYRDEQLPQLARFDFGTGDFTVVISEQLLRTAAPRKIVKQALLELANDGITLPVTLSDYVRGISPVDAYLTHYRRTDAFAAKARPTGAVSAGQSRAQLMEDAALAWRYFERWTNKRTGLCPATVNFSAGGRRLHQAVTMWDVGSQINALIAANKLGLLSDKAYQAAVRKLLPNIAGRRSQGRLLPQGWIATDKIKWGVKDFDGCDAGRLMAALYNLDTHSATKDRAEPTVRNWDLDKVIRDGEIQNVTDGEESTTYRSHCAHYAAWAFRTWGLEVRSPYEVFDGRSDSDGRMALLEAGGHIGPMGAEPLLLEAIELGMSPESAYLAEVLFAAQLEEYEETGRLTCVSEGPIDRAPWFTYQGIQFDAPGRIWATDTVESLPEHRSKEFREKNHVVSVKGAYLWAAYKDHPYSNTLVDYVRDRARTENGFASSIYQQSGQATATYADINTNGIILQAIAQILSQRDV